MPLVSYIEVLKVKIYQFPRSCGLPSILWVDLDLGEALLKGTFHIKGIPGSEIFMGTEYVIVYDVLETLRWRAPETLGDSFVYASPVTGPSFWVLRLLKVYASTLPAGVGVGTC